MKPCVSEPAVWDACELLGLAAPQPIYDSVKAVPDPLVELDHPLGGLSRCGPRRKPSPVVEPCSPPVAVNSVLVGGSVLGADVPQQA